MHSDTQRYHDGLSATDAAIAEQLASLIEQHLPEAHNKVWHAHPVWFLDGNPIVGYSRLKDGMRLLFWSGQSFQSPGLRPEGKFKAADIRYTDVAQIDTVQLGQWLAESRDVQWDYQNIVKRKGRLERLG